MFHFKNISEKWNIIMRHNYITPNKVDKLLSISFPYTVIRNNRVISSILATLVQILHTK